VATQADRSSLRTDVRPGDPAAPATITVANQPATGWDKQTSAPLRAGWETDGAARSATTGRRRDGEPVEAARRAGAAKPVPASAKLLGMSAWATALGVLWLAVALRGLLTIWSGHAPRWYEPVLVGGGLTAIALTVTAFVSVRRRRLPWAMLLAATVPLAVAATLTVAAGPP